MNTEQIIELLEANLSVTEETYVDDSVAKTYTFVLSDADWARIKGDNA